MKTESNKTHYRKVFKSDHLGSADLEEMLEEKKRLIFTVEKVTQEYQTKVAGKKIDANIAYLKGAKPLVLNATNSKTMAKMMGSKFVEDWAGAVIELYIDPNVKMKGEMVGGVRIKPDKATNEKPKLTPDNKNWPKAMTAVQMEGSTIETIRKNWDITDDHYKMLNA